VSLSRFMRDGQTFVASSREAIERSTPHIYITALPFAPKDSLIYQSFFPLYTGLISIETFGIGPHGGRLMMTLAGHDSAALSVAYSPNGRLLASGSEGGIIRIWDTRMGEEIMNPLCSGSGAVRSIVFARDGKSLVSATDSGVVCIWSLIGGQATVRRLCGHSGRVASVAFSPDSVFLASVSWDGTLRLWNAATGEQLVVEGSYVGGVNSVAFSPDGAVLASGADGSMFAFNPEPPPARLRHSHTVKPLKLQPQLGVGVFSVQSVCFSPDSTRIAFSYDHDVKIYETQTGIFITSLRQQQHPIRTVQFSPDGQSMLTAAANGGDLRLWTIPRAGDQAMSIAVAGKLEDVHQATFSPDGLYIASGSASGSVRIWSVAGSKAAVQSLPVHDSHLSSVSITSEGTSLVSGSEDGLVCVWDAISGARKLSLQRPGLTASSHLTISADGRLIASAAGPDAVWIWDASTGGTVGQLHTSIELFAMTFSPDSRWLAGRTISELYIWDIAAQNVLARASSISCSLRESFTVVFSKDGHVVATNGVDHLQLWQTATWEKLPEQAVVLSSTGESLASAEKGRICIWNIPARQHVRTLRYIKGRDILRAKSLEYLSMSPEGEIHLWDAATGVSIIKLQPRQGFEPVAAFSSNGRCAVSYYVAERYVNPYDFEPKIHVWDVNIPCVPPSGTSGDSIAALVSATLQDGWLTGPRGELLLWVPDEYREHLQVPPCKMLIGPCRVVVSVGDSGWHRGESWTMCWRKDASNPIPDTL